MNQLQPGCFFSFVDGVNPLEFMQKSAVGGLGDGSLKLELSFVAENFVRVDVVNKSKG